MRKTVGILAVLLAAVGVGVFLLRRHSSAPIPVVKVAATRPTTKPATTPIIARGATSYMQVVRAENPTVPATQPLAVPVDLPDAAHLILHDPVYLDPSGHLWITRADADPTEMALQKPLDPSEHVIPERPVFVHWTMSDNGDWSADVILHRATGGYEIVSSIERRPLANDRPYRWDRAFSWDGKIVVPTDVGVSIFDVDPQVREHYYVLPGATKNGTQPIAILDARGVLAWAPWDNGKPGSHGASRFVEGQWSDLPTEHWPDKIVQLVPLLDGSVLQIVAGDSDHVSLAIAPLESTDIDQKHISELVEALADPDEDHRQAAFNELSQYGPGLWPILEKLADDQPAEARVRIEQLLRNKIAPALGGMTLMDNRLRVMSRQSDGIALFYAPVGVKIPNGDQDPQTVAPAWICLRPGGRVDRALPTALVKDLSVKDLRPDADPCPLRAIHDDWVICDDAGARRFFGNGFIPLLKPDERAFHHLIGVDRRGRWLFGRNNASQTRPAAMPVNDTLIIDPTILDPTPKLPVWTMRIQNGSVGWNQDNWPVIQRGGPWALKADSWEPLAKDAKVFTELPPPPPRIPASTQSTTAESLGPPLLVTSDGTRYFDGRTSLIVKQKNGETIRWPLPATAIGNADPVLLRTDDGLLFLYNQPGRLLRIKPTPGQNEPFQLEAVFTQNIPNTDHPMRIWLDPLGRIDFACDGNSLSVMFPTGHIPPEISRMMEDGD